jgi:membrane protease YdiL (CAAX protease family)
MSNQDEAISRFGALNQKIFAVIGVLIALGWPFLVAHVLPERGSPLTSTHAGFRTIDIEWTVVMLLAVIGFGLQGLRPAFFRFRGFGRKDSFYLIGAFVVALVFSGAVSSFVAAPKFDLHQITKIPIALRCGLVVTAGICEEFIYRGFAIEEIGALIGSRWSGAAISLALFGLGHVGVYGFSTALLIPTSVGLVITLLYMFRNNLPICMLMHAMIDGLFLIVVPALSHVR